MPRRSLHRYEAMSSQQSHQEKTLTTIHLNDHVQRDALERRAARICVELGLSPRSPTAKRKRSHNASREEQHARFIDCGYENWDDSQ